MLEDILLEWIIGNLKKIWKLLGYFVEKWLVLGDFVLSLVCVELKKMYVYVCEWFLFNILFFFINYIYSLLYYYVFKCLYVCILNKLYFWYFFYWKWYLKK